MTWLIPLTILAIFLNFAYFHVYKFSFLILDIFIVGSWLNRIVILANGGKMPVKRHELVNLWACHHKPMAGDSRFYYLSDIFYDGSSVGDKLINIALIGTYVLAVDGFIKLSLYIFL